MKFIFLLLLSFPAFSTPKVVVTIKPLYTMAAILMKGIGAPRLLLEQKISPHDFALKPSWVKALNGADVILWVGPEMEQGLLKIISTQDTARVIQATDGKSFDVLKARVKCNHGHDHHHESSSNDPHFWLNPDYYLSLSERLKSRLIDLDPGQKAIYEANFLEFQIKIKALKTKMIETLTPFKDQKFYVFHDSLQYLEKFLNLQTPYIVHQTDHQLSLQEIYKLKSDLQTTPKACILLDEETPQKKIESLLDGEPLNIAEISPEGVDSKTDIDLYFEIMELLTSKIAECFKRN